MEYITNLLYDGNVSKLADFAAKGLEFFEHCGKIGICTCEEIMPIQNINLGTSSYTTQTTPISKDNLKVIEVTTPFMIVGSLLANEQKLLENLGLSIANNNLVGLIEQETIMDTLKKLETKENIRDMIVISNLATQQSTANIKVRH